jgi:hypothetical protein
MAGTKSFKSVVPYVLAQSAAALPKTGDTAETTLATVTVPAGALGPNGTLRITTLWSNTNSANNKTFKVKLAGTAYGSLVSATTVITRDQRMIHNRGTASSQIGMPGTVGGFGSSGVAAVTSAIDTSQSQDITFTAQLALGTETITLESYLVEVLPG